MNKNITIRDKCLETAELYLGSCGDSARIALIFMLLDTEICNTDLPLEKALHIAKKQQQINSIINYVMDKMKKEGDPVEVALWLLLKLQDDGHISNIGVDNMLYHGCASQSVLSSYKISLAEAITIINKPDPEKEFEALNNIYPKPEKMFHLEFSNI